MTKRKVGIQNTGDLSANPIRRMCDKFWRETDNLLKIVVSRKQKALRKRFGHVNRQTFTMAKDILQQNLDCVEKVMEAQHITDWFRKHLIEVDQATLGRCKWIKMWRNHQWWSYNLIMSYRTEEGEEEYKCKMSLFSIIFHYFIRNFSAYFFELTIDIKFKIENEQ